MAPNLRTASITPLAGFTGAQTDTLANRFGTIINVKSDFGAKGDGTADDTTAIQNALDAAYGTWASPHGGDGNVGSALYTNKQVYFPAGYYNVASAITRTVNGVNNNGGKFQLSLSGSGTAGLLAGDMIRVYGITGGSSTDANGSWKILTIDSGSLLTLQNSTFGAGYVSGGSVVTPALRVRQLMGGFLLGAGTYSTVIRNSVVGGATFCTDGFQFCTFQNLTFLAVSGGNGICFDANWGQTAGDTVNNGKNTFLNVAFGYGDYGLAIELGLAQQGEEYSLVGCVFGNCAVAGLFTATQNVLGHTIMGGNFAQCTNYGIYAARGSVPSISGVTFQNNINASTPNTGFDIFCGVGAADGWSIKGCRSESANFIELAAAGDCSYAIEGCNQKGAVAGYFLTTTAANSVSLISCNSESGKIGGNPFLTMTSCKFSRSDYLTADPVNSCYQFIVPQPITTQSGTSYTLRGCDLSTRIKFTNAGAVTVTAPQNSTGAWQAHTGGWVEIEQAGAGKVTVSPAAGVTINSPGGNKATSAQYAVIRLMVEGDGADTYNLDGSLGP